MAIACVCLSGWASGRAGEQSAGVVTRAGLGMPQKRAGVTSSQATEKTDLGLKGVPFFDHGDPTELEQLMLERINRARAAPGEEAARLGIDLNEGLEPGTISPTPKPPVAFHPLLIDAARGHSEWMIDTDVLSHTGVDGTNPGDRMERAGFVFTGSWAWGENIAWKGTTGTFDPEEYTTVLHENLFRSPGHRTNICETIFDQIGLGILSGPFAVDTTTYNALMATQEYARSGSTVGPLLVGVVFSDSDDDGLYDVGEGLAGVGVTLDGGDWQTATSSSGGYALPYPIGEGDVTVIFSGDALSHSVSRHVTRTGKNIKLDLDTSTIDSHTHTVTYAAGDGGAVTGECTQTVQHGHDCSAVLAVPDPGYCFAAWSDGRTDNPRTDTTVTANLAITAFFTVKPHDADRNGDWKLHLSPELTRLTQFYNAGGYHLQPGTEDGYAPGPGDSSGKPHDADLNGDWRIQLSPELTRIVQFFNAGGYHVADRTEDGYAPGPPSTAQ